MSFLQEIEHGLQTLSGHGLLPQPAAVLAQQIEQYLRLIERWNKIHNLTAVRDLHGMLYQHVLDSLAVLPHIQGPQIIDVGSGAGLPGIPLALARPDWNVTLLESNQKKTAFLQQVKIELKLQHVSILSRRCEEVQLNWSPDTIISRAFSELGNFVALTANLAMPGAEKCQWVAMKAHCTQKELDQITPPFFIDRVVNLEVFGLNADRQLIIIKKR